MLISTADDNILLAYMGKETLNPKELEKIKKKLTKKAIRYKKELTEE